MNAADLQLHLPAGLVIFGKNSLKFIRQPTWEEWQQVMEYLSYCRKTSLRWIADARHEGRREFGDKAVVEFEEQLEIDLRDLKAAAALEAMGVRKAGLSDDYHSLVAKRVDDAEKQMEWLETAERENLTPRELASSISANRIVRTAEQQQGRTAGIATIEGVRGLFDLWARQVDGKWRNWPLDKQERLFEEIRPIGEMWEWLKERLSR
ncbi:MAG TPA: hypothetical protein VIS96_12120 [Terrimicrobiaceae bacterium]